MRVWLTMDQNEAGNNGKAVIDNIQSLQMLVHEVKKERKKKKTAA